MINPDLTFSDFPALEESIQAKWAPIILEPIEGSYERLVVGIVATAADKAIVVPANNLAKLRCLYGIRATGVINIVSMSLSHLQESLFKEPELSGKTKLLFSGVTLGEIREGGGASLNELAGAWLSSLSSLHTDNKLDAVTYAYGAKEARRPDLSVGQEVLKVIVKQQPSLSSSFSRHVIEGRKRRGSMQSPDPIIDFSGKRLVANFEVVRSDRLGSSFKTIKQRLWDLQVDRDERSRSKNLQHEMLVQTVIFDKNKEHQVKEALMELEKQADTHQLRLESFPTSSEIATRVLEIEHA
jgi:hypothetical protein